MRPDMRISAIVRPGPFAGFTMADRPLTITSRVGYRWRWTLTASVAKISYRHSAFGNANALRSCAGPRRGVEYGGHEHGAAGNGGDAMPELSTPRAPTVALQGQEADSARVGSGNLRRLTPSGRHSPNGGRLSWLRPATCGRRATDLCRRIARQRADVSAHAGGQLLRARRSDMAVVSRQAGLGAACWIARSMKVWRSPRGQILARAGADNENG